MTLALRLDASAVALCSIATCLLVACGGDATTGSQTASGSGGSSGAGGGAEGGGAASTGGSGGQGGIEQTCDDLGFCGTPRDPGCAACALGTGCADALDACKAQPACAALNRCIGDCPDGDQTCFDACQTMHMDGLGPLETLLGCLCGECPVSCAVDPMTCR